MAHVSTASGPMAPPVTGRWLESLIAEVVSDHPVRSDDWSVGRCDRCRQAVWLSSGSAAVLGSHPDLGVVCVDCACQELGA
jgi:hypothetical protein